MRAQNSLGMPQASVHTTDIGLAWTQGYWMQRASLGIHTVEQLHCQMWGWHSQQAGPVHGKCKRRFDGTDICLCGRAHARAPCAAVQPGSM